MIVLPYELGWLFVGSWMRELSLSEGSLLGNKILLGLGTFWTKCVPFSQSLSTLALIEEFLGKREVPCLPGAEGQGVQKWVRNVSYFREFIAALFAEPWQGLPKGFLSLSPLSSSFLHSPSHAQEDLWFS